MSPVDADREVFLVLAEARDRGVRLRVTETGELGWWCPKGVSMTVELRARIHAVWPGLRTLLIQQRNVHVPKSRRK